MVTIQTEKCIGCGLCVKDCILRNLKLEDGKAVAADTCFDCGHCVAICPANACEIPAYPMEEVREYDSASFDLQPEHFLNAVKFRRSIRQFKSKAVGRDVLAEVLEVGRYTETAVNYQDVRFIVVQDALEEAKEMIWEGWQHFCASLEAAGDSRAKPFRRFYERWKKNPQIDRLFLGAPALLVVAADVPLDGGLASANMEMMAVAKGLGVLFNGFVVYAINHSPEAQKWLGIGEKQIASCMLLGYPAVTYRRTAPRKPGDFIWR